MNPMTLTILGGQRSRLSIMALVCEIRKIGAQQMAEQGYNIGIIGRGEI